jgi:hypothetical protein
VLTALAREEQDEAYERLRHARTLRDSRGKSRMACSVRSLQRVAEYIGHTPCVEDFKQAAAELIAVGEDVETLPGCTDTSSTAGLAARRRLSCQKQSPAASRPGSAAPSARRGR